jgi:hypothetical protein
LRRRVDHAQGWQGLERLVVVGVSRRVEVTTSTVRLATPGSALAVFEVREGRSRLDSLPLGLRRSGLRRWRDFVDARLVDGPRGGNVRVVDSAELVLAVWESAETVAPAVVTFDVPVCASNERHDRGQRKEFDQARRPDDRLAEERCQHRRAA